MIITRRKVIAKRTLRRAAIGLAVAGALSGQALAFEIDTGNNDVQVRWDNTLRFNYAQRMKEREALIGNTTTYDEGDYLFDKGDAVSKRLDVLSELDFIYKKNMGFRVSAALWVDGAYGNQGKSNPALAGNRSFPGNEFSSYVKRYYKGPSGEWLDAFVFANFDLGNTPVKMKFGRHAVAWGEALFLGGAMHSVQYAQTPLDLMKGFATPGVEAKELFRPLHQISAQAQVSNTLSIAGQYLLDWESYRFPEGGTYLGPVDALFNGSPRSPVGAAFAANLGPLEPKKSGEYGVSARWSPEALDGTVGFYYRRFADKIPQVFLTPAAGALSGYRMIYADKIDLYGISLAKNIGGVSVGAEWSYRRNTPLVSRLFGRVNEPTTQGDTTGPRGDTQHALINMLGTINKTPLFDSATWVAEMTWAKWNKVRSNPTFFQATGNAGAALGCVTGEVNGGCATRDYIGASVAFTPTWYQVTSGVDLSMPITYSAGLSGNAPTVFGGNEGLGNFSIGLGADIYQKYRVDLKYSGYFGRYNRNAAGTVVSQNGFSALLEDRDFLSLTFKTSF